MTKRYLLVGMIYEKDRMKKSESSGFVMSSAVYSKIEFKLAAHRCAQAVEELSNPHTSKIVLHVARIEVIHDVEDDDAGPRFFVEERKRKGLQDGRVQGDKGRKPRAVAWANEV